MPDRIEKILRLVCLLLAALLVYQVSRIVLRRDSLAHLNIPALPALAGSTNAPAKAKDTKAEASTTPSASATNTTNLVARDDGTNKTAQTKSQTGTNETNIVSVPADSRTATNSTNLSAAVATATNLEAHISSKLTAEDSEAQETNPTNLTLKSQPQKIGTNTTALPSSESPEATGAATNGTNLAVAGTPGKIDTNLNSMPTSMTNGTNVAMSQSSTNQATNIAGMPKGAKKGLNPAQRAGLGKAAAVELPPVIQARVDKIIQSEILGQIIHPMPMALLGIAGRDAILRAPNGQTGLVKEGDELGGVKLLRIGINRVLVEEDGQKKELTLFEGMGSQTLLSGTNSAAK